VALKEISVTSQPQQLSLKPPKPIIIPPEDALDRLAALLNGSQRVTLLCGGDKLV
jgi:pyruvate dehydrogenase (quinone)